jgi:Domain of unknown function (DUF4037)
MTEQFMPGLELSRLFYEEAVAPVLARHFPGLVHGAGRLDTGSEVLGFDTPRSMDHWWGPRVQLFVAATQAAHKIHAVLANELPFDIRGFPTHMHVEDAATGSVFMCHTDHRPINHMVHVTTAREFFTDYLGTDPLDGPPRAVEWLTMPEQHLRTIASGGVWHDDTGQLTHTRDVLRWYPDDVWRYVLAAQWRRIEQEEAFPGRCAEAGDDLGSRLVAARLVREIMHLAFLIERQYMPYAKWLGTAFKTLACAEHLQPTLLAVLAATTWPEREAHLSQAYETVAAMHNALDLAAPVPATVSPYFGRPFQVIHGDRFAAALRAAITDADVQRLPPDPGTTSQWVDSTDMLSPRWGEPLRALYESRSQPTSTTPP